MPDKSIQYTRRPTLRLVLALALTPRQALAVALTSTSPQVQRTYFHSVSANQNKKYQGHQIAAAGTGTQAKRLTTLHYSRVREPLSFVTFIKMFLESGLPFSCPWTPCLFLAAAFLPVSIGTRFPQELSFSFGGPVPESSCHPQPRSRAPPRTPPLSLCGPKHLHILGPVASRERPDRASPRFVQRASHQRGSLQRLSQEEKFFCEAWAVAPGGAPWAGAWRPPQQSRGSRTAWTRLDNRFLCTTHLQTLVQ